MAFAPVPAGQPSLSMAGDRYRRIRVDAATYRAGETVDALAGSFERMWALAAFDLRASATSPTRIRPSTQMYPGRRCS